MSAPEHRSVDAAPAERAEPATASSHPAASQAEASHPAPAVSEESAPSSSHGPILRPKSAYMGRSPDGQGQSSAEAGPADSQGKSRNKASPADSQKKTKKKEQALPTLPDFAWRDGLRCIVCNVNCPTMEHLQAHVMKSEHVDNMLNLRRTWTPPTKAMPTTPTIMAPPVLPPGDTKEEASSATEPATEALAEAMAASRSKASATVAAAEEPPPPAPEKLEAATAAKPEAAKEAEPETAKAEKVEAEGTQAATAAKPGGATAEPDTVAAAASKRGAAEAAKPATAMAAWLDETSATKPEDSAVKFDLSTADKAGKTEAGEDRPAPLSVRPLPPRPPPPRKREHSNVSAVSLAPVPKAGGAAPASAPSAPPISAKVSAVSQSCAAAGVKREASDAGEVDGQGGRRTSPKTPAAKDALRAKREELLNELVEVDTELGIEDFLARNNLDDVSSLTKDGHSMLHCMAEEVRLRSISKELALHIVEMAPKQLLDAKTVGGRPSGATALHMLAGQGRDSSAMRCALVKALVSQRADTELRDERGATAVLRAAGCQSLDVLKTLVSSGADPHAAHGSTKRNAADMANAEAGQGLCATQSMSLFYSVYSCSTALL